MSEQWGYSYRDKLKPKRWINISDVENAQYLAAPDPGSQ
jgi:hypothetical protein